MAHVDAHARPHVVVEVRERSERAERVRRHLEAEAAGAEVVVRLVGVVYLPPHRRGAGHV